MGRGCQLWRITSPVDSVANGRLIFSEQANEGKVTAGGEIEDLFFGQAGIEGPIEAIQGLEFAEAGGREWCRLGRVKAEKRKSCRGAHYQWVISPRSLLRYEREGLLPPRRMPG